MPEKSATQAILLPSSVTQQRLYLLSKINPGSNTYNVTIPFVVEGVFEVSRWTNAMFAVARRHEALRTTFRLVDGTLYQRVEREPRIAFEMCAAGESGSSAAQARELAEFLARPFDLEEGPLVRCFIVTSQAQQKVLICLHHIVCDGWSTSVILSELRQFMEDPLAVLPELDLHMADYAAWEQSRLSGPEIQEGIRQWADFLAGLPNPHRLPLDRGRGSGQAPAGRVSFGIGVELCCQVRDLARTLKCSEFGVYLALVQLWLHKITGHAKIAVGVPVANRPYARLQDVVGCFVNTFAIPFDSGKTSTITECITASAQLLRRALADQSVPFDRVVKILRSRSGDEQAEREYWTPVFQVALTYQDVQLDFGPIAGRPVRDLPVEGTASKFDIVIALIPEDAAMTVVLRYDSALFTPGTADRMATLLSEIVDVAVSDPGASAADLPDWLPDVGSSAGDQVEVRGFLVEPSQVESVLAGHPGVTGVVVTAREDHQGERRLVAYLTGSGLTMPGLWSHAAQTLPGYMVPAEFVVLESLPLAANGKVDRGALPAPGEVRPQLAQEYAPPRTEAEKVLAGIWREVLHIDRVGIHDNFFELGGDSILSLRLTSELEKLNYELPLRELVAGRTVAELAAEFMTVLAPHAACPALAGDYPATSLQLGMLAAGPDYYHDVFCYVVPLPLRPADLAAVLDGVTRRHDALRTWFDLAATPPMARVVPDLAADVHIADEELPANPALWSDFLRDFRIREAQIAFDFGHPPLIRYAVHSRPGGAEFILSLSFHHSILDGWSLARLIDEIAAQYAARSDGSAAPAAADPAPQLMSRYSAAVRAAEQDESTAEFWRHEARRARLINRSAPGLRRDFVTPFHTLSRDMVKQVEQLAIRLRCDARTIFLATWVQVITAVEKTNAVTIGIITHGRPPEDGGDKALGLFLNTVPLTVQLAAADLPDAVRRCVAEQARIMPFLNYPYVRIRKLLGGDPTHNFNYSNYRSAVESSHGREISLAGFHERTDLPVLLNIGHDSAASAARVRVSSNIAHGPAVAENLLDSYIRTLRATVQSPGPDAGGSCPSPVQRGLALHALFEAWADRCPDKEAVRCGELALTYRQVEERANRLAWVLRGMGVGPGAVVGVSLPRGVEVVWALLGVLKSGGVYVPLDAALPRERLDFMVADAGAVVVVGASGSPRFAVPMVRVDEDQVLDELSSARPEGVVGAEDLAYVIYTSGSTGRPKGVMVQHGNCVNLMGAASAALGHGDGAVWSSVHSISFDFSVWEIFGCLSSGGTLVMCTQQEARDPRQLVDVLRRCGVAIFSQTPSAFRSLVSSAGAGPSCLPPSVKTVIFGGEALDARMLRPWAGTQTAPTFVNMYGITEATVHETHYTIPLADEPTTAGVIGQPLANTRVVVLDGDGRLARAGTTAELFIGGAGVARGYVGQPGLTAERFVPDGIFGSGGRLYRTGDLARWRPDGLLEFAGRADDQVKVRGFRVEPAEVESVLAAYPGVTGVVVTAREDHPGERQLVAYLTGSGLAVAGLRSHAAQALPEYMVPAVYVVLDSFPLTANGKVSRGALPAPDEVRPQLAQEYVAPGSATERILAGIWAELLHLDRVGIHDNFFELGGDSILSIQIVARAAGHGIAFTQAHLYEHPTVAGIVGSALRATRTVADEEDTKGGGSWRARRLAPMQEGMLFYSLLEGHEGDYIQQVVWRLPKTVHAGRMLDAWNAVVARYDILRTGFRWATGVPATQIVAGAATVPSATTDWSATPAGDEEAELTAFLRSDRSRGFDLTRSPLMRLTWIELRQSLLLVWTYHHLLLDGWSLTIVLPAIFAEYERREKAHAVAGQPAAVTPPSDNGEPLRTPQYSDFLDWLESRDRQAAMAFWRSHLEGFDGARSLAALPLRTRYPAVMPPSYYAISRLDSLVDRRLRALAADCRITLNNLILGAWALFIARWSGATEAVFGTVVSGRLESLADWDKIVGLCMNTVPVRISVPGQLTIGAWLRDVQHSRMLAREHEWISLTDIHRAVGATREHPLFTTSVAYERFPSEKGGAESSLRLARVRTEQPAREGVLLAVVPDPFIELRLDVSDTDLGLTQTDVSGALAQFTVLLAQLAAKTPTDVLGDVGILGRATIEELLASCRGPKRVREHKAVHEWFASQSERTPAAVALTSADGSQLSYGELNERCDRLARYLSSVGVALGDAVGICADRSFDLIVALIGTLKAGACYVPLEAGHPAGRLEYMLEDCGARILLTQRRLIPGLPDFSGQVICIDEIPADLPTHKNAPGRGPSVSGRDTAYIIYTSGSTGRPKGVVIEHGALANFVSWCVEGYAGDRLRGTAVFSSVAFDAVVPNLYPPLVMGRTVHLLPQDLDADTMGYRLQAAAPYSFLKLTPSHLSLLAKQLSPEQARHLAGLLVVGAEAFPLTVLKDWRRLDPETPVLNEYGPTEATVANCTYRARDRCDSDLLPIGLPIPNTTLYVLDEDMRLVPHGVIGELYIGGDCVAQGYKGMPALTAERFLPDPFSMRPGDRLYRTGDLARMLPDGNFYFLGRIDDQVKINGYRIEPAEVEAALLSYGGIDAAHVRALSSEAGSHLVAYVAGRMTADISLMELRRHLDRLLPRYMHPARFVTLDVLPLTPHGKIDRARLPEPTLIKASSATTEPATDIERLIANVWSTVLGVKNIGLDDNFFELGGDSVLSIQVVGNLASRGLRIGLRTLFSYPTIRQLSGQAGEPDGDPGTAPRTSGQVQLTPVQHWFFRLGLANPHHYNQWMSFRVRREKRAIARSALEKVVAGHDAFRLRFRPGAGGSMTQSYADEELSHEDWLMVADFSGRVRGDRDATLLEMTAIADKLQRGLDLYHGPLLRAGIIDLGEDDDVRLVLVIHHLVVDAVSWRILADDLELSARAIAHGQTGHHDLGTSAFGDWAAYLARLVASGRLSQRQSYWRAQFDGLTPLFAPGAGSPGPVGAGQTHVVTLDRSTTSALLREVPRQLDVRIDDILLAALSIAIRRVLGREEFVVDLEGHGRDSTSDQPDVTRTVGWFTSISPVRLCGDALDLSTVLRQTASRLQRVRENSQEYGLLRHLAGADCGADWEADVSFNYLGQVTRSEDVTTIFNVTNDFQSCAVDPGNRRAYALDIGSVVSGGELITRWMFTPGEVSAETIAELSTQYSDALRSLLTLARDS